MIRGIFYEYKNRAFLSGHTKCVSIAFLEMCLFPIQQRSRPFANNITRQLSSTCAAKQSPNTDPIPDAINPETPTISETKAQTSLKLGRFINTLTTQLDCTPQQAQRIFKSHPSLRGNIATIESVCKLLNKNGVTDASIIENPFLLGHSEKILDNKLLLLRTQKPRNINDFVPLLRATPSRLNKIRKLSAAEAPFLPGGHRIYYLAERLSVEPRIVAKHLSTHLFMFDLPAEQLIENLDIQLEYNVASLNILRDPWAFRYSSKSIIGRLARATEGHKDKLMPWMVRCPESILAKSIKHSMDEKELLGDRTLVEYVADRLGYDVQTTKLVLDKHPAIYNVRVTKINDILDYFLNESEFTAHDVAQVPRILCHSLATTRQRLDELRALGCKPSSLVIVCRSANEYRKFINGWGAMKERINARIARKTLNSDGVGKDDHPRGHHSSSEFHHSSENS